MTRLLALAPLMFLAACGDGAQAPEPQASPSAASPVAAETPAPAANAPAGEGPEVAASIPAAFHGTWDNAGAPCDPATDARLTIAGDTLMFYESRGSVTRVEIDSPTRIVVSADYEGEGEKWQQSYLFELRENGQTLSSNSVNEEASTPLLRKRCG